MISILYKLRLSEVKLGLYFIAVCFSWLCVAALFPWVLCTFLTEDPRSLVFEGMCDFGGQLLTHQVCLFPLLKVQLMQFGCLAELLEILITQSL